MLELYTLFSTLSIYRRKLCPNHKGNHKGDSPLRYSKKARGFPRAFLPTAIQRSFSVSGLDSINRLEIDYDPEERRATARNLLR